MCSTIFLQQKIGWLVLSLNVRFKPKTTKLVFIVFAAVFIAILWAWLLLGHHQTRNIQLAGLSTAKALADEVVIFRQVYTQYVLKPAENMQCTIGDGKKHALPLPVTLVKYLGKAIEKNLPGSWLRIYSEHPFPDTFQQRTLDSFEQASLAALTKNADKPYYKIENIESKLTMRYAVADRMTPSCVTCHNQHPSSPKSDWQVGDVRGVVEVAVTLDEVASNLFSNDLTLGLLLGFGFFFLTTIVVLFIRYDSIHSTREKLSRYDELTGTAIRRYGLEVIEREIGRAQRHKQPLSFALFDLDHFKKINDTHGHLVGDNTLRSTGKILCSSARSDSDLIIRWGGEEFLAVLPHTDRVTAKMFAERVRQKVEQANITPGVSLSAGVSMFVEGESVFDAIKRADDQLYQAKDAGRNRVC